MGATRILVADTGHGVHATAYLMAYRAHGPLAMVLPVPVRRGTGEEALAFVDLGGYRRFFEDLARCSPGPRGGGYGLSPTATLPAQEVGDSVASYVPSVADFRRLDPRFRLPAAAWESLPDDRDLGFAVFQLRPGEGLRRVHPIAYRYPAERPGDGTARPLGDPRGRADPGPRHARRRPPADRLTRACRCRA